MSQSRLFLSRFLLCVWAVLFAAFLSLVLFEARGGGVESPMAGVYLNAEPTAIHLPNRIFTCTELEQGTQCQAEVQGHPLVLDLVSNRDSSIALRDCQAQYDGQPVACTSVTLDYAPALSESVELGPLGLTPQQLQAVRQQYWGVNALLWVGERKLLRITLGLSMAAGAIAAVWAWCYPSWLSKGWTGVTWGFAAYRLTWMRLASVQYDAVTPYGFTASSWDQVVTGGAIAAGAVALLAVIWFLRGWEHRAARAVVTLSSGFGAMAIAGYTLMLILLGAGFVD